MSMGEEQRIVDLLGPLLHALDHLAIAARHMHPPNLAVIADFLTGPEQELRAAVDAQFALGPWPGHLEPLVAQLDQSTAQVLAGLEALRKSDASEDRVTAAYRAMGHLPRALEALYPLAGVLAPVNRFFLDKPRREDETFAQRFMGYAPENTGVMRLGPDPDARETPWLYAPEARASDAPMPLIVALHGGSGHGRSFLWSWLRDARSRGALLLAPSSTARTWALQDEDVDGPRLRDMVELVRANWPVDPARILLAGMSDGGTYAWLTGLETDAPYTHIAPCSAAFHPILAQMADGARIRSVPIHITHGALDWMFPVDLARLAERTLTAMGASVTYREIADLSHTFPTDVNADVLDWMDATASGR
jgi:phospholipase/carboxylesterase